MKTNNATNSNKVSLQLLIGFALCSEFAYIGMASLENLGKAIPVFLLFFGIAFVLYWLSVHLFFVMNGTASGTKNQWGWQIQRAQRLRWLHDFIFKSRLNKQATTREVLTVGILFGIIFRITLLFTAPSLSDDIYRYIWDGKVASSNTNPYMFAPEALPLQKLRDPEIYPKINHKEIPTVYPPISQTVFRGIFLLSPTVLGFKVTFLFLDLLTAAGLFLILGELGLDTRRLLIYLWNPLLILETAGSGHADIIGIVFLTFALYYLIRRHFLVSTAVLVLSFLTKFIAVFILPFQVLLKKENKLSAPLVFLILVILLYYPYADAGSQLVAGLSAYTEKWQFNSSVFSLLVHGIEQILPESLIVKWLIEPQGMSATAETILSKTTDLALWSAKAIIVLIFGIVALKVLWNLRENMNAQGRVWIFSAGLAIFGTFIIVNPTVHPWYLCWLLPFLVVSPNRAWLLLTGLCALSYWVLAQYAATGTWEESIVVRLLEYLPFYALLFFDYLKGRTHTKGNLRQSN